MENTKKLRRRLYIAIVSLLCALLVTVGATLAWYIFTVRAHTTKVHMAAGASVSLQIGKEQNGTFGSAVDLEEFRGVLYPVSTNRIQNGFQRAGGFVESDGMMLANLFKKSESADRDYIKAPLYLRGSAPETGIYLADIGFTDSDEENPVSSAVRVGFVAPDGTEHIFAISDKKNPQKQYNTVQGAEGHVLDSTKTDGSTVPFTPLTPENYCDYDEVNNIAAKREGSVKLCTVRGDGKHYGEPVKLDVYIWLEGCDEDCILNIGKSTLQDMAFHFVGITEE